MLDRDGDLVTFRCDECGESEVEGFSFEEALEEMKASGWRIEKVGSDWRHTCPDCLE